MNNETWKKFVKAREKFRHSAADLSDSLPGLKDIQQKLADSRCEGKNHYAVETPVVYNTALDDITINDEIKLIFVADNPGRREQAAENRRYLVGPSGKIAEKFFRDNPALGIDFRKNAIILNKTPIHSPRTVELRELCKMGNSRLNSSLAAALDESQRIMASLLFEFQQALCCPVWITGYSEMKNGGIFEVYTETLKKLYSVSPALAAPDANKQILLFRHFSMNQFTIDLKQRSLPGEKTAKSLKRIGEEYRKRFLNF